MQVEQLAQRRFAGMEVIGSSYPIPDWKAALLKAAQATQFALLGMCIFGEQAFRALGVPPPELYVRHVAPNKLGAGIGVWFVGNMLVNSLQQTGAFEVYFDGTRVFSKLEQGRMPTLEELFGPIDKIVQRMRSDLHAEHAEFSMGRPPGRAGVFA